MIVVLVGRTRPIGGLMMRMHPAMIVRSACMHLR
jgi:hypothetical protein